ncbi:uncharacterized protein LOC128887222 isoform X2 [Hylaeus anthracinus]|uniref:uncharacterized protein LOC128887222 isoform X2 n=1 Tax=Hylaeus anthracinus TaxID=313031 RepID=UPI0023B9176B|nr:uncharacterized protein LOC128887222 isoform X2 [Hylaeus anthracinus]
MRLRSKLEVEEADEELLEHEAEAIRTLEIQAKVVRSMERLYAVPSEKLRVWSIWLAKIGEIADQWQRWLRARIDLVVRIAEHLEVAEDAIRRDEEKGDKPSKVSSRSEQPAAVLVDSPEKTPDEEQEPSQETLREVTDSSSVYVSAIGIGDEMDDDKNARDKPTESEVTLTQEKETLMTWPIGMPWQHLGEKVEIEEEEIEKLPMPRNEEEMRAFFKEFTHEATVYRSYYKHWRETADQATKVMGGRYVMATFIVQGKGKRVEKKVPVKRRSRPKKTTKRRSPVKKTSRKAKKPKGPATDGESPNDAGESTTQPVEKETPAEDSIETENDEELVTPAPSETPTVIEVAPEPLEPNTEEGPSNGTKESIVAKPDDEWQEVTDLVKDCARAAEPIPYFFYLKAEPDIEIAIEHDDEVVIPADTDRETIVGNYKRVWFNLAEKPLKGGKPYI